MYFSEIQREIESKYKKNNRQKIAEKCLQLGEEWTRIVSGGFGDFSRFRVPAGADPQAYKKDLKAECTQYIKDNLDPDEVKNFVPIWVLPFIFQVFLSTIISWIVRRIFDNMFEKEDNE